MLGKTLHIISVTEQLFFQGPHPVVTAWSVHRSRQQTIRLARTVLWDVYVRVCTIMQLRLTNSQIAKNVPREQFAQVTSPVS